MSNIVEFPISFRGDEMTTPNSFQSSLLRDKEVNRGVGYSEFGRRAINRGEAPVSVMPHLLQCKVSISVSLIKESNLAF
jgi:hypothetical protein